ncbi:MAG: hypothetical protein NWQ31_01705 [Polaribacter sp.]|nr:hypothetical protein [Polaribacter sp.]
MKNILLICCVLIINLSFAQEDLNLTSKKIFYTISEENNYILNTHNFFALEKQEEIHELNSIKAINNSEGKFPLYSQKTPNLFEVTAYVNPINIIELTTVKINKNSNDFIHNVIVKILQDKNIAIIDDKKNIEDSKNSTIESIHNYVTEINNLIITHKLYDKTELQVGKDLYSCMNKMLKTDIDKTLQNSLNLFVINY